MSREYLCQYGNCHNTDVKVTVTSKSHGVFDRYCCWLHAALGCLSKAMRVYDTPANALELQRTALQTLEEADKLTEQP